MGYGINRKWLYLPVTVTTLPLPEASSSPGWAGGLLATLQSNLVIFLRLIKMAWFRQALKFEYSDPTLIHPGGPWWFFWRLHLLQENFLLSTLANNHLTLLCV